MEAFGGLGEGYDVVEVLAEGGSSLVLHAKRREDEREVAVKVVRKNGASKKTRNMVATEIDVLTHVRNERVVELVDVIEDPECTYLVLEYVRGGDLFRYLTQTGDAIEERDVLQITQGVAQALHDLHQQGIAHRDLKLENIMLEDLDTSKVKLVDFGMARRRKRRLGGGLSSRVCGTPLYLPPEIVEKRPYAPEQVDMWCLGVVLHVLITGTAPFSPTTTDELYHAILHDEVSVDGPAWEGVSKGMRQLVYSLLSKDPARRPSAEQCLGSVRSIETCDALEAQVSEVTEHSEDDVPGSPLANVIGALTSVLSWNQPNESHPILA